MIGRAAEKRGHWIQALMLSVLLHGAAAAAIMDKLPGLPDPPRDRVLPEIDILSLPVENATPAPVALDQMQPVGIAAAPVVTAPVAAPVPAETLPELSPDPIEQPDTPLSATEQPVLTPSDDMLQAATNLAERAAERPDQTAPTVTAVTDGLAAGTEAGAIPPAGPGGSGTEGGSPQQNQAVAELVQRLRGRLAQPCLAAMPQIIAGGEVMLTVLGAVDRDIADLFRDMTGTVDVTMTERSVLLDARQCAAVDFTRSIASYPALPLTLRLEASEITSDERLIGQIEGAGQNPTTLLLIDDNGVVQDLRRFTLQTGDVIRFDVPVQRVGGDRDTSQLLIAIAAPERPALITELDGRLAEDFFQPLSQAIASGALIGVAPVYIRAPR